MLVYGVPDAFALTRIATEVGVRVYGLKGKGKAWQFDLRRHGEKYRRTRTAGSRRVCGHGYRDYFAAVFAAFPEASVRTRQYAMDKEEFGGLIAKGRLPNPPCQCEEGKERGHADNL